jgi:hypothetical protein
MLPTPGTVTFLKPSLYEVAAGGNRRKCLPKPPQNSNFLVVSLGVQVKGDLIDVVIPRNTPIPVKKDRDILYSER